MSGSLFIVGGVLLALVALARLFGLARFRIGWALYLTNVFWEVFPKKLGMGRCWVETLAAGLGLICIRLGGAPWTLVGGLAAGVMVLEAVQRLAVRLLFSELRIPRLVYMLEGPFVARLPRHQLGVLWVGRPISLELQVVNSSRQPWPNPLHVRLEAPAGWLQNSAIEQTITPLPSGGVGRVSWTLRPNTACSSGEWIIRIDGDQMVQGLRVSFDGCRRGGEARVVKAAITRYPGGRKSAFVWRGDMDLYDVRTFQSIEGLETTLGQIGRASCRERV